MDVNDSNGSSTPKLVTIMRYLVGSYVKYPTPQTATVKRIHPVLYQGKFHRNLPHLT